VARLNRLVYLGASQVMQSEVLMFHVIFIFFLLNQSGILAYSPDDGITLKEDGEKAMIVVRFQCSWQSGLYNVYTENSLVRYYCLRAWTAFQRLPFDKEHLQWYVSNYDIENNKPTDFYD